MGKNSSSSDIGLRVSQIRRERKLSQEDVAIKLGMSRSNFSQFESGIIGLSTSNLSKIAEILNTSVDYLVNGGSKGETTESLIDRLQAQLNSYVEREKQFLTIIQTLTEKVGKLEGVLMPEAVATGAKVIALGRSLSSHPMRKAA